MSNSIGVSCEEGCFSLADALALYFLQSVEPFAGYRVVNVESEEQMMGCPVLVGVGDTYDATKGRFSHYGSDHTITMASFGLLAEHSSVTLSSAGLVYASFGPRLLREKFHADTRDGEEGSFRRAYRRLYEYFVEVVDCLAFGTEIPNSTQEKEALSDRLAQMEEELAAKASKCQSGEFIQLVADYSTAIGKLFEQTVDWYFAAYLDSYKAMRDAVRNAEQIDPSGLIVVYDAPAQLAPDTQIQLPDVINRLVEDEAIAIDYRPQIFVVRDESGSGANAEKYRVACHLYPDQLDDCSVAFPDDWVYGWREHVPEMGPHLEYIDTSQLYAVVAGGEEGRLSAIHLARRLVDLWMEREPTPFAQSGVNGVAENGTANVANGVEKLANGVSAIQLTSSQPHPAEATTADDEGEEPIHYEYCFEVMSTESTPTGEPSQSDYETVSVWLAEGTASLAVLESVLRDEYHLKWPDYRLCHRPGISIGKGNTAFIPLQSNGVTDSCDFWDATAYNNSIVYAVPNSQAANESASAKNQPSLVKKSSIDPASARIGLNAAGKWGVAELLACAVMKSAMDGWKGGANAELASFSKAQPGASYAVKIGERGVYCFEDSKHHFDGSTRVSLATLDVGTAIERLSCAGIAFALYGRQSIKQILAPIAAKSTPDEKSKFNPAAITAIHRRIHTRLVRGIDSVVGANASLTSYSTPEADALVAMLNNGAYPLNGDSAGDVETKFHLAEAIAAGYYHDAIVLAWRHYCAAPPTTQ